MQRYTGERGSGTLRSLPPTSSSGATEGGNRLVFEGTNNSSYSESFILFFLLNFFFFLLKVYQLIQDENWQRSTSPQFFSGEARSARGVFGKHKAQFVRGRIDL